MFRLIKTEKYDNVVEKISLYSFFVYQLLMVVQASCWARAVHSAYKILSTIIVLAFLFIILCDFYYFLRGKFQLIEIIIYAVLGIILLISLYNYRNVMVIANLVVISTFKNIDYKKVLKMYVVAVVLGMLFNLFIGILTPYDSAVVMQRLGKQRTRHGLGFFATPMVQHYLLAVCMGYMLLKKNLSWYEYLIMIVLDVIVYVFSLTKSSAVYLVLMLILHCMFTKFNFTILKRIFSTFAIISYLLFFIIAFFMTVFYNPENKILAKCNSILTGRLALGNRAFSDFWFKLFGQNVPIENGPPNHVDSSMLSMLILNGLIVLIISLLFMTFFTYISVKTNDIVLVIALFIIAFRSSFDCGFMAIHFSPTIFLFMPMLNEYLKMDDSARKI